MPTPPSWCTGVGVRVRSGTVTRCWVAVWERRGRTRAGHSEKVACGCCGQWQPPQVSVQILLARGYHAAEQAPVVKTGGENRW